MAIENDTDYLQKSGKEEALNLLVGSNSAVTALRFSIDDTYAPPVGALFTYTVDLASSQIPAPERLNGPYRYWTFTTEDFGGGSANLLVVFGSADNAAASAAAADIGGVAGTTHLEVDLGFVPDGIPRTFFFRDGITRCDMFTVTGPTGVIVEIH